MMKKLNLSLLIACGLSLMMFSCAGDDGANGLQGAQGIEGPQGPAGPEGPMGPGYPAYTYVGNDAVSCHGCHSETIDQWATTGHAMAYQTLVDGGNENNPYCLHCHTTGWDAPVAFGDTVLTAGNGADNSGFDDFWPGETAEDMSRMAALEGVQCEACHGNMGPTIYQHDPEISFATRFVNGESQAICGSCHTHQIEQWAESGHGMVYETHGFTDQEEFDSEFNRSSCVECHTAEGFIRLNDPDYAGAPNPENASLIGCVACHDPHGGPNEAQLRDLDDYTVVYNVNEGRTYTGYGTGQSCVQCHHARRDVANVEGQIANGNAHFGPHSSPQMDMFLGDGSYEIAGYTYDRDHTHQNLGKGCLSCHMVSVQGSTERIHDFNPGVAACAGCHQNPPDFNVNGFQTEIENKLAELLAAIGVPEDSLGSPTATTPDMRMAAYAYEFVTVDGSRGAHNPAYSMSLLQNAIDYMNSLQ